MKLKFVNPFADQTKPFVEVYTVEDIDAFVAQLQSNIDAEIIRAEAAEADLHDEIVAETTRAEAAEADLHDEIVAETTRAEAAEANLHDEIVAEETRAKDAENVLKEAIIAEKDRAEAAEADLHDEIVAEKDRAEAAEKIIQDNLDDHKADDDRHFRPRPFIAPFYQWKTEREYLSTAVRSVNGINPIFPGGDVFNGIDNINKDIFVGSLYYAAQKAGVIKGVSFTTPMSIDGQPYSPPSSQSGLVFTYPNSTREGALQFDTNKVVYAEWAEYGQPVDVEIVLADNGVWIGGVTVPRMLQQFTRIWGDSAYLNGVPISQIEYHEDEVLSVSNIWNAFNVHFNDQIRHITQQERFDWNECIQDLHMHMANDARHLLPGERQAWNDHLANSIVHVTQANKDYWNSKAEVSYVNQQILIEKNMREQADADLQSQVDALRQLGRFLGSVQNVSDIPSFVLPSGATIGDYITVYDDEQHQHLSSRWKLTSINPDVFVFDITYDTDITGKIDKLISPVGGKLTISNVRGGIEESALSPADVATQTDLSNLKVYTDNAITDEATARDNAVTFERNARISADNALSARIDALDARGGRYKGIVPLYTDLPLRIADARVGDFLIVAHDTRYGANPTLWRIENIASNANIDWVLDLNLGDTAEVVNIFHKELDVKGTVSGTTVNPNWNATTYPVGSYCDLVFTKENATMRFMATEYSSSRNLQHWMQFNTACKCVFKGMEHWWSTSAQNEDTLLTNGPTHESERWVRNPGAGTTILGNWYVCNDAWGLLAGPQDFIQMEVIFPTFDTYYRINISDSCKYKVTDNKVDLWFEIFRTTLPVSRVDDDAGRRMLV